MSSKRPKTYDEDYNNRMAHIAEENEKRADEYWTWAKYGTFNPKYTTVPNPDYKPTSTTKIPVTTNFWGDERVNQNQKPTTITSTSSNVPQTITTIDPNWKHPTSYFDYQQKLYDYNISMMPLYRKQASAQIGFTKAQTGYYRAQTGLVNEETREKQELFPLIKRQQTATTEYAETKAKAQQSAYALAKSLNPTTEGQRAENDVIQRSAVQRGSLRRSISRMGGDVNSGQFVDALKNFNFNVGKSAAFAKTQATTKAMNDRFARMLNVSKG